MLYVLGSGLVGQLEDVLVEADLAGHNLGVVLRAHAEFEVAHVIGSQLDAYLQRENGRLVEWFTAKNRGPISP